MFLRASRLLVHLTPVLQRPVNWGHLRVALSDSQLCWNTTFKTALSTTCSGFKALTGRSLGGGSVYWPVKASATRWWLGNPCVITSFFCPEGIPSAVHHLCINQPEGKRGHCSRYSTLILYTGYRTALWWPSSTSVNLECRSVTFTNLEFVLPGKWNVRTSVVVP